MYFVVSSTNERDYFVLGDDDITAFSNVVMRAWQRMPSVANGNLNTVYTQTQNSRENWQSDCCVLSGFFFSH